MRLFRNVLFVIVGILSAGLGLKGFLLPNGLIDGGMMGIALLVNMLTPIHLPFLVVGLNLPFVYMGYRQVGWQFAVKTFFAILGLAFCLVLMHYPVFTYDKTLVSVFGGFFLGAGIGLTMRGGCVIDGTEIVALYLSRRSNVYVRDVILVVNVVIFSVLAFVVNLETALYSILTYLSASKTVDFVVHGIEDYVGVTIVSVESDEIRKWILYRLGRGVTIYNGKRGFGKRGHQKEMDVLYTVVTRLELSKLNHEIEKMDDKAFMVMSPVSDIRGGMVKRRGLR